MQKVFIILWRLCHYDNGVFTVFDHDKVEEFKGATIRPGLC